MTLKISSLVISLFSTFASNKKSLLVSDFPRIIPALTPSTTICNGFEFLLSTHSPHSIAEVNQLTCFPQTLVRLFSCFLRIDLFCKLAQGQLNNVLSILIFYTFFFYGDGMLFYTYYHTLLQFTNSRVALFSWPVATNGKGKKSDIQFCAHSQRSKK